MDHTIARLGLALAIGLLVGLERCWREREAADNSRTAGIRTFGLSGLLGGIFAALAAPLDSSAVLIAGFVGFAAIFAWFSSHEAKHDQNFSVTGVVAALSVFALGALALAGNQLVAAARGAALAGVLASREMLHGLLRRLTWIELRLAIVLAAMTAIILPLLPDKTIAPWGELNPFEIWSFTVIVAAISFGGYVAVPYWARRRDCCSGRSPAPLFPSTAVTVALARMASAETNVMPLVGGAALVSILRVCAIVALLAPQVLSYMIWPAVAGGLVLAVAGGSLLRRSGANDAGDQTGRNPFEL